MQFLMQVEIVVLDSDKYQFKLSHASQSVFQQMNLFIRNFPLLVTRENLVKF